MGNSLDAGIGGKESPPPIRYGTSVWTCRHIAGYRGSTGFLGREPVGSGHKRQELERISATPAKALKVRISSCQWSRGSRHNGCQQCPLDRPSRRESAGDGGALDTHFPCPLVERCGSVTECDPAGVQSVCSRQRQAGPANIAGHVGSDSVDPVEARLGRRGIPDITQEPLKVVCPGDIEIYAPIEVAPTVLIIAASTTQVAPDPVGTGARHTVHDLRPRQPSAWSRRTGAWCW